MAPALASRVPPARPAHGRARSIDGQDEAVALHQLAVPAAGFPEYAKRRGAKLAIVNRETTPLDDIADVVVHDSIGTTMGYVASVN